MNENSLSRSIPPRQMIVMSSEPARALTTGMELVSTVRSLRPRKARAASNTVVPEPRKTVSPGCTSAAAA